jgi:hypothetical protein
MDVLISGNGFTEMLEGRSDPGTSFARRTPHAGRAQAKFLDNLQSACRQHDPSCAPWKVDKTLRSQLPGWHPEREYQYTHRCLARLRALPVAARVEGCWINRSLDLFHREISSKPVIISPQTPKRSPRFGGNEPFLDRLALRDQPSVDTPTVPPPRMSTNPIERAMRILESMRHHRAKEGRAGFAGKSAAL